MGRAVEIVFQAEMAISRFILIFGIPAAAAWFLAYKYGIGRASG